MATRAAFASSSSSRPSTTAARRDARASAVAVRVRARDGEIGSGRDATSSSSSRRLCHLHRRPASTLRGALQRVRALHRGTLVWTLPPEMTRSTPTPTLVWPASAHGARGERAGAGAGAGAATDAAAMSSSSSSSNLSSSDPPPAAALTTSPSSNPPVTGGPILTPKRPPAAWTKRRVPEGGEETRPGEEGGDRVQNYHDQNVARWNSWWVDAVAANNTEALDMLAKMPWSDVRVIVSSMRMMAGKPDVFEAVVRGVCRRADGVETVESVGGLTTLAWAAKARSVRSPGVRFRFVSLRRAPLAFNQFNHRRPRSLSTPSTSDAAFRLRPRRHHSSSSVRQRPRHRGVRPRGRGRRREGFERRDADASRGDGERGARGGGAAERRRGPERRGVERRRRRVDAVDVVRAERADQARSPRTGSHTTASAW